MAFPWFHVFVLTFILILSVSSVRKYFVLLFKKVEKWRYFIFPAAGFLASLAVSVFVFGGIPHVQDGLHYVKMAETFSEFRLYNEIHPHYDFFWYLFQVIRDGKVMSIFQPGFPLFLVPFIWFKIPFVANPLLLGVNIFLCGKISEKLFSSKVSLLSMIFVFLSPFMTITGGSFLSHPFCSLLTMSALLCFFNSFESEKKLLPLCAGIFTGILVFSRPQNALYLSVSLLAGTLIFFPRIRYPFRNLLFIFVGILPGAIVLALYNIYFTGNPFVFLQDIFFSYSEPRDFCHRPGFGKGCPFISWTVLPPEGVTLLYALKISHSRFTSLIFNTFSHPLIFIFIPLTFGKSIFLSEKRREKIFLMTVFLIFAAGYFPFFLDGNAMGPRYFYEITFLVIILVSAGIHEVAYMKTAFMRFPGVHFSSSLIIGAVIFSLFFTVPHLLTHYSRAFWNVDSLLRDEIEKREIENSVFFIHPEDFFGSGFALMDHRDIDKNSNIFTRDMGDSNINLMHYYPDRDYYRVSYENVKAGYEPPEINRIYPRHGPEKIVAEMEMKMYPVDGVPDLCAHYPFLHRTELYAYLHMSPVEMKGFQGKGMFCRFRKSDSHYTFGQYFPQSGKYSVKIKGFGGTAGGKFDIFIKEKKVTSFDTYNEKLVKTKHHFSAELEKGLNFFTVTPVEEPGETPVYFFFDKIIFEKQ